MFFRQKYSTIRLVCSFLTLLFVICLHSYAFAQNTSLEHAQAEWCKRGLLRPDFCNESEKKRDTLDLIAEVMQKIMADAMESGLADEDYQLSAFEHDAYKFSVQYWSKPHPEADEYSPIHPDTLKHYQNEAERLVKTLFKEKLFSKAQQSLVLEAIKNNTIHHPYFAVAYLAQLYVEDYLRLHDPASAAQAKLNEAAAAVKEIGVDKTIRRISFEFPAEQITPEQFEMAVRPPLAAAYPEAKMLPGSTWEHGRLFTQCRVPIPRNALVFAWDIGEEVPLEIEIDTRKDSATFFSHALITSDVLPYMLLQLEQNRKSALTSVLKISPLTARDYLCGLYQIPVQQHLPSPMPRSVTYYLFSEAVDDADIDFKLHLGHDCEWKLEEHIQSRRDYGLSSKDKWRLWKKFQKSTLMDVYTPDMQRYLWVNLNSFPMRDSFEYLRQLGLADYPGNNISLRFSWTNDLLAAKPHASGILKWLSELSDKGLDPKAYSNFSAEKDKSGFTTWLNFECNGKPFHVYVNSNSMTPADILAIEGLASAWNKTHSGDKAFYYIYETRMILYRTQAEIDKLSEALDWLIVKM